MATVYLAVQTSLDRKVAIKVMRRDLADDNLEKRYLLEGRTMARLPHRNIAGIHDIVQNEHISYICMEYLEGGSLSQRMRQGLSVSEAVAIVVQLASALQYAHENAIVHRDLKPANILFRDRKTPVLTDFGIAREQDAETTRLTQTGMLVGTPVYMSPEQVDGGDVDGRSDQYALGVLFHEMLTGRPPFEGDTPVQVLMAHINKPPPPLPKAFSAFQPLLDRMLAKDPDKRFADLRAFSSKLRGVVTSTPSLQAELFVDPNEAESEQLRALGFSESQIHSGTQHAGLAPTQHMHSGSAPKPPTGQSILSPGRLALYAVPVLVLALVGVLLAWWPSERSVQEQMPTQVSIAPALQQAEHYFQAGQLTSPPGQNAYEVLRSALQTSPEDEQLQEQMQRLVSLLLEAVDEALGADQIELAEARLQEAMLVDPENRAVVRRQARLDAMRLQQGREARVEQLLERAELAQAEQRLHGDADSAFSILRQALELAPEHPRAQRAFDAVIEHLLEPAREALEQDQLSHAESLLDELAEDLASESVWLELEQQLVNKRDRVTRRARINAWLMLADSQIANEHLAEPPGSNALETLTRITTLEPDNRSAQELLQRLGWGLVRQAREAAQQGEDLRAMARYDLALQAVPDQSRWRQERAAIADGLGDREARIAEALSQARAAIADGRFLQPPGDNALQALNNVLTLDADNADAREQLEQLPRLIHETALSLEADRRLQEAVELLRGAIRQYPRHQRLGQLQQRLNAEWQAEQQRMQRRASLQRLHELLDKRHLSVEVVDGVGESLGQLRQLNPDDSEVNRVRGRFMAGMRQVFENVSQIENLVGMEILLTTLESHLDGQSDVLLLRSTLEQSRERLKREQRWRETADLARVQVNPLPWAMLESVHRVRRGEDGEQLELLDHERNSTPLHLRLAEGEYRLLLRHPDQAEALEVSLSVEPREQRMVDPELELAESGVDGSAIDVAGGDATALATALDAYRQARYAQVVAVDLADLPDEQAQAQLMLLHSAAFWTMAQLGDGWAEDAAIHSRDAAQSINPQLAAESPWFPPRFHQFWRGQSSSSD